MKWLKETFIKFIKWLMSIKSVSTMSLVVFGLIFTGYYICKKDISLNTVVDIYKDLTGAKIVKVEPAKVDTIIVTDSIKVK